MADVASNICANVTLKRDRRIKRRRAVERGPVGECRTTQLSSARENERHRAAAVAYILQVCIHISVRLGSHTCKSTLWGQ